MSVLWPPRTISAVLEVKSDGDHHESRDPEGFNELLLLHQTHLWCDSVPLALELDQLYGDERKVCRCSYFVFLASDAPKICRRPMNVSASERDTCFRLFVYHDYPVNVRGSLPGVGMGCLLVSLLARPGITSQRRVGRGAITRGGGGRGIGLHGSMGRESARLDPRCQPRKRPIDAPLDQFAPSKFPSQPFIERKKRTPADVYLRHRCVADISIRWNV